ncbi:MAG: hypothetical protein EAZ08_12500 [Cytophagales bacterium]|nr:MAG: hypothetical protein EAZ08_12500 [Cytophagales bacterium]
MKKLISVFLLFVYAFLSVGVSVGQHFCGEYLAETHFVSSEKKTCKCSLINAKKGKKSNCCHDEVKVIKLEMSQNITKIASFDFLKISNSDIILPFLAFDFFKNIDSFSSLIKQISLFSPPPESYLYLFFCVFRI